MIKNSAKHDLVDDSIENYVSFDKNTTRQLDDILADEIGYSGRWARVASMLGVALYVFYLALLVLRQSKWLCVILTGIYFLNRSVIFVHTNTASVLQKVLETPGMFPANMVGSPSGEPKDPADSLKLYIRRLRLKSFWLTAWTVPLTMGLVLLIFHFGH